MYYLIGYSSIIENVKKVVNPYYLEDDSLHSAYNRYLEKNSIFETPVTWEGTKIVNFDTFKNVSPNFSKDKSMHFKRNSKKLESRIKSGFFEDCLDRLKGIDDNIYNLSNLLIKMIIVNHLLTYTNGTLDDTLGLSIMNFKDEFSERDFIELVFHQIVHMSLFLDDIVLPHMNDQDKNRLIDTSLIYVHGGNAFPAYIAFHSYMVGVEMLRFREVNDMLSFKGAYHGDTRRIIKVTKKFQDSLIKNIDLFLDRGRYVIDNGVQIMSKFSQ